MPASCTTCTTAAGPTVRIAVDTVNGPLTLALTLQQARDLLEEVEATLDAYAAPAPE